MVVLNFKKKNPSVGSSGNRRFLCNLNYKKQDTIESEKFACIFELLWKYLFSWVQDDLLIHGFLNSWFWHIQHTIHWKIYYSLGSYFCGFLCSQKPRKLVPHEQFYFHSCTLVRSASISIYTWNSLFLVKICTCLLICKSFLYSQCQIRLEGAQKH